MEQPQVAVDRAPVYDLQGQRIAKDATTAVLPKGLYISQGRKFLVSQ